MSPVPPYVAPADFATDAELQAAVSVAVAALVDSAPLALDTLNELAAALNDDPNAYNALAGLINDHVGDLTAAHLAAAIEVVDAGGNFTAADLEAVLAELADAGGGGGSGLLVALAQSGSAFTANSTTVWTNVGDPINVPGDGASQHRIELMVPSLETNGGPAGHIRLFNETDNAIIQAAYAFQAAAANTQRPHNVSGFMAPHSGTKVVRAQIKRFSSLTGTFTCHANVGGVAGTIDLSATRLAVL